MFEEPAKVGRPSLNPRRVFNAIMWILKSGARWRDLSARYGNWNSIFHKFRLWCSLGLFERLLKVLNADAKDVALLELDSTFCKVHQSACSGRILTGGQIHDSEPALALLSGVELGGKKFLRIKLTVASKFAVSSLSTEPLLVSPTKPISGLSMTLIQSCTSNATSLKDFFSESRITVTSPLASTNWLFALRISFY